MRLALLLAALAAGQSFNSPVQDAVLENVRLGLLAATKHAYAKKWLDALLREADKRQSLELDDLEAIERAADFEAEYEQQSRRYLNRALELVEARFSIRPKPDQGSIVNGPIAGMQARWRPIYRHKGQIYWRMDGRDGSHYEAVATEGDARRYLAETWPDGSVTVRYEAFLEAWDAKNAGALAALLAHEAVHFEDLVTTGWTSAASTEMRAHEAELAVAERVGLSEDWRQTTKADLKQWRSEAKRGLGPPFRSPQKEAEIKAAFEKWADEQRARAFKIARYREDAAKERELEKERRRLWHFEQLENFAFNVCAYRFIEPHRLANFKHYQPSAEYARRRRAIVSGEPCDTAVLQDMLRILETGGRLAMEELNARADAHDAEHDRAIQRRNELDAELRKVIEERQRREEMRQHIRDWIAYLRGFSHRACHQPGFDADGASTLYSGITQIQMYKGEFEPNAESLLFADLSACAAAYLQWMYSRPLDTLSYDRVIHKSKRLRAEIVQGGPYNVPPNTTPRGNLPLPTIEEILERLKR